jgi:hypothetical protein
MALAPVLVVLSVMVLEQGQGRALVTVQDLEPVTGLVMVPAVVPVEHSP